MLASGSERHGPGSLPPIPYLTIVILGVIEDTGGWGYPLLPLWAFTLIQSGLTDCGPTIQYQSYFRISRLSLSI